MKDSEESEPEIPEYDILCRNPYGQGKRRQMNDLFHRERIAGNTDTGMLKCIALVFMLVDHIGVLFFSHSAEFRIVGRIAMPLYAWCMVVGCCRTRNIVRYAFRMLLTAILCQPLYMLVMGHKWNYLSILFLLFLGITSIAGIRLNRCGSRWWIPAACFLVTVLIDVDYGWKGLLFMILLYLARGSRGAIAAVMIGYCLFWGQSTLQIAPFFGLNLISFLPEKLGARFRSMILPFFRLQALAMLSLPFLLMRGKSGRKMPKTLSYLLYPLHLLLLLILRLLTGTSFTEMLSVFR